MNCLFVTSQLYYSRVNCLAPDLGDLLGKTLSVYHDLGNDVTRECVEDVKVDKATHSTSSPLFSYDFGEL